MESQAVFKKPRDVQVYLISLPWTNTIEPSLGLAQLKAILEKNGISVKVLHMNLFLLEHLKAATYEALSVVYGLNDFLFSATLDARVSGKQQRILREKALDLFKAGSLETIRAEGFDLMIERLLNLRNNIIPGWLNKWADEISASNATLVGCTCMFDQTIASVALGKLIKERSPQKMFVLGGYAVRDPTGTMLMKAVPWIDAICTGEGEITAVELARASLGELPLQKVRGIIYRDENGTVSETPMAPKADINNNPVPDYDDFFEDTDRLSSELLIDLKPVSLPVENSRGCWWGAKHHCTFCGIHDDDMAYRHRESQRVYQTLQELKGKYGMNGFRFADYILPNQFYGTLLPALANNEDKFMLSCEIKANVTDEQFKRLALAGFYEVQPGIESFNANVLRKMKKGVTGIQNVYTLKLGKKYGVNILYNILYGFPDDECHEYEQILELLPKISHLSPPVSCVPVQITRYAPLQTNPERFGIPLAKYASSYEIIFSDQYIRETGFDYDDFCYYFERTFENSLKLEKIYGAIYDQVVKWSAPSEDQLRNLIFLDQDVSGRSTIKDTRTGEEKIHALGALAVEILESCDHPIQLHIGIEKWRKRYLLSEINTALNEVENAGLVFREEGKILSLVLPGRLEKDNPGQKPRIEASLQENNVVV